MVRGEFKLEMDRLERFFGCRNYKERVEHYWRRFQKRDSGEFIRAVDQILDSGKVFPSVNQLLSVLVECGNSRKQTIGGISARIECDRCDGSGFMILREDGYNVAYRGNCSHGAQLSDKIGVAPNV